MRKITAAIAGAATVALLLAGCSGSGDPGDSDGKITLDIVGFQGGGAELAHIPEMNKAFEKKYPNVTINYKYVQNDQYDQYNNTRLAAGNAADVIMTNPSRVRGWQKQGYLADLSDQAWVKDIVPNVAPFGEVKDKTYALTVQNIGLGLYANMDLLKTAGIDTVPETWPEFIDVLQKLKSEGKPGVLIANQIGWGAEQTMLALGANLIDKDWGAGYDSGKTDWYPTWTPVMDHVKELISDGLVDPKLMNGIGEFQDGNKQFADGDWAFTVMGAWQLADFDQKAKFDFTFNPFPGGAKGSDPTAVTFVGTGWAVNDASKHQEAAKNYLDFAATSEQYSEYIKAGNSFTTLTSVETPELEHVDSFAAAYKADRFQVSPVEFLQFPGAEVEMRKVTSSLFNDPSQSTATLLKQLDSSIPKTK